MNILIVNPSVTAGGGQKIMLSLAYHLQALGHRIIIHTTLMAPEGLPEEFRRFDVRCSRHQILKKGGITTRYQHVTPLLFVARLVRLRAEIRALIRQEAVDIVLAHQPPAPWLCSFLRAPAVWNCFEPVAPWPSRRPEYFALRPTAATNPLLRLLEALYERCDRMIVRHGLPHVFVLSQRLQRQVASLYGRESEVFYPGSDCAVSAGPDEAREPRAPGRNGVFRILQVGQFHYGKNHLLTLDVVKRLRDERRCGPLAVAFAGEGELEPAIRRAITAYGLEREVTLHGSLPLNDPRLAALYRSGDVLVFPSFMQSWGLVPFEALANGVVPIVSTETGAAELIRSEDIGYVAQPTAEAFYEALVHVHDHPEEAREKAERGRRFVAGELTYAQYAARMSRRLQQILETGS